MSYVSEKTKQILNDYARLRLKKAETIDNYYYVIENICNFCKKDFPLIDYENAKDFFNYEKNIEKKDSSTLVFKRSVLMNVAAFMEKNTNKYQLLPYEYAEVYRLITFEADKFVRPEDLPKLKDVDRLLSYLKITNDYRTLLSACLALKCALTTKEMLNLRISDLIENTDGKKLLRIRNGIPEAPDRFIELPIDLIKIIDLYLQSIGNVWEYKANPDHPLFTSKTKRNTFGYRSLANDIRNACTKTGVNLSLNDLRNLCLAYLIKNGAAAEDISSLTGTTETTYNRLSVAAAFISKTAVDYNSIYIRF